MSYKKWVVRSSDKEYAKQIAQDCGIDQLSALLLVARGHKDSEDVEDFVFGYSQMADPFEMVDMQTAVDRIKLAVEKGERIAVYGDYDADGITATVLLVRYLLRLTDNVTYYIPDRCDEGYGINKSSLDKLCADKVNLIVTVDNGISCLDEIDYAKEIGIDVIVTDHHLPGDKLPAALAVVDPHRSDYCGDYCDYAGVGVAFKLACALEGGACEELIPEFGALAALGTIADIVPLTGENRMLVRDGIRHFTDAANVGINALISACGLKDKPIGAQQVAFILAPRINAAGRMGSPAPATELLLTDDLSRAQELAQIICERNTLRQTTERETFEQAQKYIVSRNKQHRRVIVVWGDGWHQGVLGIVASKIVERFGKPAVVISVNGEYCKGSARSFGEFSMHDALESCSQMLEKFGGHRQAAGMSLRAENLEKFDQEINRYAEESCPGLLQTLDIDCRLNPVAVSVNTAKAISFLAPFGASNPVPIFGLFGMTIENITPVGNNNHIRLTLSRDGCCVSVMKFGTSPDAFAYSRSDMVDVAVTLDAGEYQGRESVTASAKDIRPAGIDEEFYSGYLRYEQVEFGVAPLKQDIPERGDIASIYRELRATQTGIDAYDRLYARMEGKMSFAKIHFCIEIMSELGIIKTESIDSNCFRFVLPAVSDKRDIESSAVLAGLRTRVGE